MQTERGRSRVIDLVALPASKFSAGASACPDASVAPGILWYRFMALLSLKAPREVEDRIVLAADRAKPRSWGLERRAEGWNLVELVCSDACPIPWSGDPYEKMIRISLSTCMGTGAKDPVGSLRSPVS